MPIDAAVTAVRCCASLVFNSLVQVEEDEDRDVILPVPRECCGAMPVCMPTPGAVELFNGIVDVFTGSNYSFTNGPR